MIEVANLIPDYEVWWDAIDEGHAEAAAKIWKTILAAVVDHAEREGRNDAEQGDATEYSPGGDGAYINAVGSHQILQEIGLDPYELRDLGYEIGDIWDEIVTPWCDAFERARRAAFGEES